MAGCSTWVIDYGLKWHQTLGMMCSLPQHLSLGMYIVEICCAHFKRSACSAGTVWQKETEVWHTVSTYFLQSDPQKGMQAWSLACLWFIQSLPFSLLLSCLDPCPHLLLIWEPKHHIHISVFFKQQNIFYLVSLQSPESSDNNTELLSEWITLCHIPVLTSQQFLKDVLESPRINSQHICTFLIINKNHKSQRGNTSIPSPGASSRYHHGKQQKCGINNKWSK